MSEGLRETHEPRPFFRFCARQELPFARSARNCERKRARDGDASRAANTIERNPAQRIAVTFARGAYSPFYSPLHLPEDLPRDECPRAGNQQRRDDAHPAGVKDRGLVRLRSLVRPAVRLQEEARDGRAEEIPERVRGDDCVRRAGRVNRLDCGRKNGKSGNALKEKMTGSLRDPKTLLSVPGMSENMPPLRVVELRQREQPGRHRETARNARAEPVDDGKRNPDTPRMSVRLTKKRDNEAATHSGPKWSANGHTSSVLTATIARHTTRLLSDPRRRSAPSPKQMRPSADERLKPACRGEARRCESRMNEGRGRDAPARM